MNYYQIPQKYTYGNNYKSMDLQRKANKDFTDNVDRYEIQSNTCYIDIDFPTQQPPTEAPKRNYRVGDAIKVTTWHTHGKIQLKYNDFLTGPNGSSYAGYAPWPWNTQMFMNFRLFAVEVDVGQTFDAVAWFKDIHNWVTWLPPTSPTSEAELPVYTVHEKMLRKTTTWTGKYRVLIDRPFKITSKSTNLDFQIEIPFNRRFEWQEGTTTGKPRIPNIYVFIMGPMSSLDVDQDTAKRIYNSGEDATERPKLYFSLFKKLNFIDL